MRIPHLIDRIVPFIEQAAHHATDLSRRTNDSYSHVPNLGDYAADSPAIFDPVFWRLGSAGYASSSPKALCRY